MYLIYDDSVENSSKFSYVNLEKPYAINSTRNN